MAGNTLNFYDPLFYAQEALIVLEKELGMASRIHRGYDPTPQQKGSTINISQPASFTAQDAPGNAQDLNPGGVSVTLNQWKEVKFKLTDKELTFTKEKIISDHIRPAAYAIADCIDQALFGLVKDIYNYGGTAGTTPDGIEDITGCRRLMQDALIPDDGRRHFAINTAAEEKLLQLAIFNQNAGAPAPTQDTLLRGSLGTKMGLEIFPSQNVPTVTNGTTTAANASGVAGSATLTLASMTPTTGTIAVGQLITIAGSTQKFTVIAGCTGVAGAGQIVVSPALPAGFSPSGAAITFVGTHAANIAFHRNAFCLAMAPLSELGNNLGARMNTLSFNDLSIRSRVWYDGDSSAVYVGLDVLFGVKTLDPKLAVRYLG